MRDYDLYVNVILEVMDIAKDTSVSSSFAPLLSSKRQKRGKTNVVYYKIEKSIMSRDKKEFMQDEQLQDATLMRLQVIGENIKKIPLEIKKRHKDIKWKKFEKLRNIISHKYESVDYNIIWSFIENNLEELKLAVLKIK